MPKKGDWVIAGGAPGEMSHCTRCGEALRLGTPVAIAVFLAASKAFVKVHSKCQEGKYFPKPPKTPEQWAAGRDTGTSSLTIYAAITGNPSPHDDFDVPHDPDDFGRCYRLLKLFPSWRGELEKVAELCPSWRSFVKHWDELTAMYEAELPQGRAPLLYKRIEELGG